MGTDPPARLRSRIDRYHRPMVRVHDLRKNTQLGVMVKPEAFHLRNGEEDLTDYQYGRDSLQHLFCKHCGMRSFARGHSDAAGGDFVTVRLACLDEVDPKLLAESPVRYADGLNDNWWNPPSETRHL
jgi:hypothetical protein